MRGSGAVRVWRRPLHSLPARLGFFVLGATLCTALIISAIALSSMDSFLRDKIEESFPAILERTATELDSWYKSREANARVFAGNAILNSHLDELIAGTDPDAKARARDAISSEFERLLADEPLLASAFLLTGDGDPLLWQGDELELSMGMREEIRSRSLSRAGYSRGRYFQVTSVELEGDSGVTLHLIVDLEELVPILQLHAGRFSGRISIVGADRRYLASSSGPLSVSKYPLPLPKAGAPVEVADSFAPDGRRVISSAIPLARLGWSLVIEQGTDLAFARVVAATRRVLAINLAIVAIFALIAYRFAIGLVHPIEALSEAARRISEGERNVQIPHSKSRDEVGLLTRAFFEMTSRNDADAREIENAHRNVEEVNAELRGRNDELHRANQVLAQLSITDGLTQLHNHRFFQDSLVKEAKRADRTEEPLSLILIDIDHFKSWNDRLGHAGGDEILRRIAEVMNTLLRSSDLLARYGGEEFALVATGTNLAGAVQLAEKMRSTISQTRFFIDPPSEHQRVTVSMGVSLYHGDRKRFFGEADQALYRAKAAGRDCVVVFDTD
ncbi:MAG: diguanylate cyclase [Deltaproteobacteria bacterium]|nr:diguanylate cyclase [Deltaproteobacteria bacterium]